MPPDTRDPCKRKSLGSSSHAGHRGVLIAARLAIVGAALLARGISRTMRANYIIAAVTPCVCQGAALPPGGASPHRSQAHSSMPPAVCQRNGWLLHVVRWVKPANGLSGLTVELCNGP